MLVELMQAGQFLAVLTGKLVTHFFDHHGADCLGWSSEAINKFHQVMLDLHKGATNEVVHEDQSSSEDVVLLGGSLEEKMKHSWLDCQLVHLCQVLHIAQIALNQRMF